MSAEIWKDIEGYEDAYKVSNIGRVLSCDRKKTNGKTIRSRIMKTPVAGDGYNIVMLTDYGGLRKYFRVSRLVASAFVHNPGNKPYVNHIDGNKLNDTEDNLEWCTAKENTKHALVTGLIIKPRGENHHQSKLSNNNVVQIRQLLAEGISLIKTAEMFEVSPACIWMIKKNINWKYL